MRSLLVLALVILLTGCTSFVPDAGHSWKVFQGLGEYARVVTTTPPGSFDADVTVPVSSPDVKAYLERPVPSGTKLALSWWVDDGRFALGADLVLRFPNGTDWREEKVACDPAALGSIAGNGFTATSRNRTLGCDLDLAATTTMDAPRNGIAIIWTTLARAVPTPAGAPVTTTQMPGPTTMHFRARQS